MTYTHLARTHRAPNRAQVLDDDAIASAIAFTFASEHSARDRVGLYLSLLCGLRAQEIALLEWQRHVLDASGRVGSVVRISADISKKGVAREVPIPSVLKEALVTLIEVRRGEGCYDKFVFYPIGANAHHTHLSPNAVAQWFKRLYERANLNGCSSHSGRRTYITSLARTLDESGCSLEDVRRLVGHKSLNTTQKYIDNSARTSSLVEAFALKVTQEPEALRAAA